MQLSFDLNDKKQHKKRPRLSITRFLPALLAEHGTTCHLCKMEMIVGIDELHVDHLIPYKHGGPDEWHNFRPVHAACNLYRQSLMLNDPRLPERIVKAKQIVLFRRNNPHKKLCFDCLADISHLNSQRLRCDTCREELKTGQKSCMETQMVSHRLC